MSLKRTPMPRRTTRIKASNPARKRANWTRAYGSPERCAWIASQPCVVMGCRRGPCENCHAETGGTGRKADADQIFPACPAHHRELHTVGVVTFSRLHSLDLAQCARETALAWATAQGEAA